jgi:hypothetical protein
MLNHLRVAAQKTLGFALVLSAMASVAMAVPVPAPEIDAGSAASAVTLLLAGAAMLKSKFRAR